MNFFHVKKNFVADTILIYVDGTLSVRMPRKRTSTKRKLGKRKAYRKRSSNRKRGGNIARSDPTRWVGFPKNKVVKMRYVQYKQVDLTNSITGGFDGFYMWANGIHDPDVAIGGHQPMGHDQWQLFYNHYVVLGAKCKVTYASRDNVVAQPIIVGISIEDDVTSGATNVSTIQEYGGAKYKMFQGYTSMSTKSVTAHFSAKKFFNVTDMKDNQSDKGANFGANPTDGAYFRVFACTADGTSATSPAGDVIIGCNVEIEYIVALQEPKELPQS